MNPKVKALAWEEFRVGGAISAVSLLVGLFTLVSFRLSYGWNSWGNYDPDFVFLILLGVPVLTALLLILSPNYSGHLAGGFSTRVLRLPVRVSIAVAAALILRTLFVFVVTLVMTNAAHVLFGFVAELRIALLVVLFYVFAQAMDWLRGSISGLSSILLVLCVAGGAYVLIDGGDVLGPVLANPEIPPLRWGLVLTAVMAAAYVVSVVAVHATRVGRSTGIPEIWEWPRIFSLGGRGRQATFSSPMSAQVWFEVRRAGWTLPAATLLLWLIASGVLWLYMRHDRHSEEYRLILFRNYSSVLIFVSFFLATFVHGIRTRVIGFGRNIETSGHEWMQPLTSAEFARARIVSNAILFLPTLLLVTLVHFALIGGYFLTTLVPEALATGTTSVREVVWAILSRGVLLGIIAWTFVAVGTRLLRASAAVAFLIVLVLVIVSLLQEVDILPELAGESALWAVITLFLLYHVSLTGVVYARSWKKGVIPLRTFAGCAALWALVTGFIYYVTLFDHGSPGDSTPPAWDSLLTSLAYASLVVLPYPAILLDVCRRRHATTRDQDPTQHEGALGGFSTNSKVGIRILAAATAAFALWLGWPAKPAYETVWRSNGYPVTLAELDAWYKEVPDAENMALKYSAVAEDMQRSSAAYYESRLTLDDARNENLLIVGNAHLTRREPLTRAQWESTEAYWQQVTAPFASQLKELGEGPSRSSRYPIDLLKGYMVDLPHLAPARQLARELSVDALYWTLASDTSEAVESIRAIFPIADSLSEEPVLISQLVRFAILGIASSATERMLNRAVPTDNDLARLSEAIELAVPTPDEPLMLKRSIVGESVFSLTVIGTLETIFAGTSDEEDRALLRSFNEILNPSTATRIVLATNYERHIREASQAVRVTGPRGKKWEDEMNKLSFVAPLAMILGTVRERIAESEWRVRMQLEVVRTGLAVERYRLKHGRLPENLEALVPTFLPSVPDDAFAGPAQPIRYRFTDDGEYVVYSLGFNKEDDGGEENGKAYERDITFTVAPLHIRTQDQIAP